MVEFTFLEVHLEESDVTANAPYSYGKKDVEAGDGPPPEPAGSSRNGAAIAAIIGLVFLAIVAFVAGRRYLDEGNDENEDEFDFDE
jgi:hypothetical protein